VSVITISSDSDDEETSPRPSLREWVPDAQSSETSAENQLLCSALCSVPGVDIIVAFFKSEFISCMFGLGVADSELLTACMHHSIWLAWECPLTLTRVSFRSFITRCKGSLDCEACQSTLNIDRMCSLSSPDSTLSTSSSGQSSPSPCKRPNR
jgi:hypothetical protein